MMMTMQNAAPTEGAQHRAAHYHHALVKASKIVPADHQMQLTAFSLSSKESDLPQNTETAQLSARNLVNGSPRGRQEEAASADEVSSDEEDEELQEVTSWEFPVEGSCEYGVDPRDEGTADKWVKRHPEMVRLTGRHPFNSEPPLSRLMEHGFLTPTSLHYVRNHGPVPQALYSDWRVEVSGLVRRPQSFSMKQLVEGFAPHELPVTLVCAGNRRKEQNMFKKTIGFSWGAAAVSTSVWRGARLCDILRRCGVTRSTKNQRQLFVCFEGAEKLPGGGGSHYGTSIPLEMALDESRDVLVAFLQNGLPMEPDHGFPVRMIIPGFIGGRMVKWLTRIYVADCESQSYYHIKDNRVLPSHVDADKANAEDWWHRPDYLINELNINSAIASPAHGEMVAITSQTLYTVGGYAYSGGGRKVTRVEVTLDQGESWKAARVVHTEKPTKYGKFWCWCFWELSLDMLDLLRAKEIAVRAWDAAMNTQPQNLTWNLLGMMNNCWFRVQINLCKMTSGSSNLGLSFEHPTVPGNQTGGWMKAPAANSKSENQTAQAQGNGGASPNGVLLARSSSTPALSRHENVRMISNTELKQHNTPESPWIVVHNNVYDCTKFLSDHPGGKDSILLNAGTDCTEEFDAIHSSKAKAMLEDYKIGELSHYGIDGSSTDTTPDNSMHGGGQALTHILMGNNAGLVDQAMRLPPISEVPSVPVVALDPRKRTPCKLIFKKALSHDVCLFRFALPCDDQILGLPCGKHIFLLAKVDGKLCMRAYTPVSSDKEVGYFELLVKVYFQDPSKGFPRGGLMSQHLASLQIGDMLDVKGPLGHIHYLGQGAYKVDERRCHMKACAMLAGGTGITPMYQLIREMLENPEDNTQIFLIFANRREEDIMLRDELDRWSKEHPLQFKVWYVLSCPPPAAASWQYGRGRVNEQILKTHFPPPSPETTVFLCGPTPLLEQACYPNLARLGYSRDLIFEF